MNQDLRDLLDPVVQMDFKAPLDPRDVLEIEGKQDLRDHEDLLVYQVQDQEVEG